ncbi:integrase core domain-containing protein, partial [Micromonospora sp. NPDC023814]|uniref:integrase core domain-containing protein n=1 Tax=Micromonospora sp. NPDC023814 TaxID=3154596 RepID=UPI003408CA00
APRSTAFRTPNHDPTRTPQVKPTRRRAPDQSPAQYTSAEFARYCVRTRIRTSVGRTGVCWDNAAAESFFATLKNEMYHRQRFDTRARARFAVAEYIEVFYNRQRLHSALDYRTPAEALTEHQTLIAA